MPPAWPSQNLMNLYQMLAKYPDETMQNFSMIWQLVPEIMDLDWTLVWPVFDAWWQTQLFYDSQYFVRDNLGEPVPEETFTHSHLSWSPVSPYLLPPSITIHGILPVQFACLTVFFHNLSPSFLRSTSWPGTLHFILHTFLHRIIVFCSQHMPIPSQPGWWTSHIFFPTSVPHYGKR